MAEGEVVEVSRADALASQMLVLLADVRAEPLALLVEELADARDVVVDSPEAEVLIAQLEEEFGVRLAGQSDLEPEQIATIRRLARLVDRALSPGPLVPRPTPSPVVDDRRGGA